MSSASHAGPPPVEPRPLAEDERQLLDALLSSEFSGCAELIEQAVATLVRSIDSNGSLEFVRAEGPPSPVVRRIPVEAEVEDADGTVIHVLLHVLDGRLNELEIYREDSGSVLRKPAPEQLQLIVL